MTKFRTMTYDPYKAMHTKTLEEAEGYLTEQQEEGSLLDFTIRECDIEEEKYNFYLQKYGV